MTRRMWLPLDSPFATPALVRRINRMELGKADFAGLRERVEALAADYAEAMTAAQACVDAQHRALAVEWSHRVEISHSEMQALATQVAADFNRLVDPLAELTKDGNDHGANRRASGRESFRSHQPSIPK
jgi:hypothetical protein